MKMDPDLRSKLMRCSTASIATSLFKRGLRNQYVQNVGPVGAQVKKMVGPAFTLRYIPAREDRNELSVFRDPDHPQRLAVEKCPDGHVMVMDSRKDARAASAGSILISRLNARGCAGIVTDGGFRDAQGIAELDIPAFHSQPSAPTNLTLNEAIDMNVPIACGDAAVFPGDIIVGDQDGVMVIPEHLAQEVADECAGMELFEQFVAERVAAGQTIVGLYPMTDPEVEAQFERWKDDREK